jgi:hypothetical protein
MLSWTMVRRSGNRGLKYSSLFSSPERDFGSRDQNFDGTEALFLISLRWRGSCSHGRVKIQTGCPASDWAFLAVSFCRLDLSVINSSHLWQAQHLPALIFAIPPALGWGALGFDSSKFRISFFLNVMIAAVVLLTVFDSAMFTLQRNPLTVALGAQNRAGYIARTNPSYAALMKLMDELPADAQVYSLFEPRSYALPRRIQSDPINYNFSRSLPPQDACRLSSIGNAQVIPCPCQRKRGAGRTIQQSRLLPGVRRFKRLEMLELVKQTDSVRISIP